MRYILIMWVMRTSSKLADKPSFCGSLWMSPVNSCVDPHTMFTEYNQHSASVLETPRASLKLSRVKWIYLGGLWRSLQDERTDALLVAVLVHDYERMRQPGRYERKHNITIPPPTSAVTHNTGCKHRQREVHQGPAELSWFCCMCSTHPLTWINYSH